MTPSNGDNRFTLRGLARDYLGIVHALATESGIPAGELFGLPMVTALFIESRKCGVHVAPEIPLTVRRRESRVVVHTS